MPSATRSFRIRAYPNSTQQRFLDRWFGAVRWIWNTSLDIRSEGYRSLGLKLTGIDISRMLTQWKRTAGHEWLSNAPATCLVQCLRDQDRAFANFFSKRSRYPKRRRKTIAGSLRFQDAGMAWDHGQLQLPKLGALKLAEALPAVTKPDMVTVTRDPTGSYYISFSAEVDVELLPVTGRMIGVDLGLTHLATLSSGEKVKAPKHYRSRLRYLRCQQRCLARRQKNSKRRERQRIKVARACIKVANARQNSLQKLTTRLVREFDVICIEDLNVKAMARGMHSRSIHDAAFGEFRRQIEYKSSWYGRTVIAAGRFYPSSKTCSGCGHRLDELRLDVRQWMCPKCGREHDRDINAAQNLLAEGIRQLAGGNLRDMRADGKSPCTEATLAQVFPREARSGQICASGTER